MPTNPAVALENVSKVYRGGIEAVTSVSLEIPAGKIVALLGTSGCGKTTTLRLINRLEEPTVGTIRVRGKEVRKQKPEVLRRSIGYVIQEGGLFPHLNVWANVATVPRLLGWQPDKVDLRVGEVLEMVGLPRNQFVRRMPSELSGGQRQRVGVARALAADPDILLMDEPFGALDPGTRETIQDEFLRLHSRLGKTVILVTHDIAEAAKLAGHIVLMDRGQIIQQGSIKDLLLHPADERVRSFLGKQGQGLALEVVRLSHLIDELMPVPSTGFVISLAMETPLSQVLVALADAPPHATVQVVDAQGKLALSALQIRQRALAELRLASNQPIPAKVPMVTP